MRSPAVSGNWRRGQISMRGKPQCRPKEVIGLLPEKGKPMTCRKAFDQQGCTCVSNIANWPSESGFANCTLNNQPTQEG